MFESRENRKWKEKKILKKEKKRLLNALGQINELFSFVRALHKIDFILIM